MRRTVIVAAVVVACAAGAAIAWRIAARPSYNPVRGTTALDAWRAPWPAEAARGATVPKRWIVVGWDGAYWNFILPMLKAGELPNLAALMREGAYGDMLSFKPTWSPVLWTTVATGVDPAHHGILAWGRVVNGHTRTLFTNRDRRVKALWNLMTDAHRPSLVVGYHNTFPADRIDGLMVSNYLYHEHLEGAMGVVDPQEKGDVGLVYPIDKLGEVLEVQRAVAASLPEAVFRFADIPPDLAPAFEAPLTRAFAPGEDQRRYFLKKAYTFDEFDGRVAEAEYPKVRPELAMVHFQCIDLASHYFLYFFEPHAFDAMPWTPQQRAKLEALQPLYGKTVASFYRFADAWLGRLMALRGPDTGLLLLSDHGFEPEPNPARTGYHVDAPPGIFVVAGPGVAPGKRARPSTLYDVFPTVAATLGLPLADDLRGSPQTGWFAPEAWKGVTIHRVASYQHGGRYVPDIPTPDETQQEILEQLRAIGYVR